jgi:hypothetical protein
VAGSKRGIAAVALLLAIILATVIYRGGGPAPKPANAPGGEFSAVRAAAALHGLFGGNAAHPVGSVAHGAVRERLAAALRALGYDVIYQHTFACNAFGSCAPLINLIARAPGQPTGDTVVVASHYDSVPAGPGASDDGLGVATTLEVARALRAERLKNPVTFLITDGEESGLLGAEGFVADADASRNVAAVINTEARGTSGRSFLFETSRNNRRLIPIVARALPRPSTSSLYFNIYELLPNDTDMTVFKRAGIAGVNFANIGTVQHYHTPLDSLDHLSLPLLQDDGEHVLAMARALGAAELRETSDQNAAWFDVLSFFMIWWPQGWTVWLTLLALAMILLGAALRIREDETTARAITFGVVAWLGAILGAFVLGVVVSWLAGVRAGGVTWVAHPLPAIAAMWLLGGGVAVAVASLLLRRAGVDGLFFGGAICWSALAVVLLAMLPGGAYLALVPALVLGICALLRAIVDLDDAILAAAGSLAASVLLFPVASSFYDALGRPVLPAVAALIALAATTLTPLFAPLRRTAYAAIAAAVVLAVVALMMPPYSAASPRRLSIRYVNDDGKPAWQAAALTPALRNAASFAAAPVDVAPWLKNGSRLYAAPAPDLALPRVDVRVLRDARAGNVRTLLVGLRSARAAARVTLFFHAADLVSLRVNGRPLPEPTARHQNPFLPGWHRVSVFGASEAEIEIVTHDAAPIEVVAADTTFGLPPAGAALARARDGSLAVPSDDGDVAVTIRRARL